MPSKKCQPKQSPAVSPALQRAAENGWTESHLAARKRIAEVIRLCRSHYKIEMKHHWVFMVRSVRIQLNQAFMDCQELDGLRAEQGLEPLFMDAFTVYNNAAALAGIHCRAIAELKSLSEGKRPSAKAVSLHDFEKAKWKLAIERFREALRDGRTVGFALQLIANSCCDCAENGRADFFEDLGEVIRKHRRDPLRRSLTEWIVRAWLPLCLWECESDGEEAHARFCNTADLLGIDYLGYKDAKFYHQFVTAWRNTRSKKMKVQA